MKIAFDQSLTVELNSLFLEMAYPRHRAVNFFQYLSVDRVFLASHRSPTRLLINSQLIHAK